MMETTIKGKWEHEDYNYIHHLKKWGIVYLTGEACGLAMRGLYDITPRGEKLLDDFLGGAQLTSQYMNGRDGAKHSMMISSRMAKDLFIYGLLFFKEADYVIEVTTTIGSKQYPSIRWYKGPGDQLYEDLEKMRDSEHLFMGRSYQRSESPGDGMRHVHHFSGRMR
jgi:hypothetical protein